MIFDFSQSVLPDLGGMGWSLLRALRAGAAVAGLSCISMSAQQTPLPVEKPTVLHISTREALLDVVARDRHGNPVNDLAINDFQVFELGKHSQKTKKRILWVHQIDPRKDASRTPANEDGVATTSGAVCALNATKRYKLAIPASPEPGYHEVLVKTSRPQVTLSYRRRYIVGETVSSVRSKHKNEIEGSSLEEAACLHPAISSSLAISAFPLTPGENTTRYVLIIRPESLTEIGLDGSNSEIQLDFGVCTFDAETPTGRYRHWTLLKELSPAEVEQAHSRGLMNLLEIPGTPAPEMARFVVRDRPTGNLGTVDVATPFTKAPKTSPTKTDFQSPKSFNPLAAPIRFFSGSPGSFGSVTPGENSFCGDVYELPSGTPMLPDFWNLEPVGSIYTDSLHVPNQPIYFFRGIPGVTANNWFGVDYYGEFYVTKPGRYVFELHSDDGSRLEIDNEVLIDIDGTHPVQVKVARVYLAAGLHTIHVPHMQSLPNYLALELLVQLPGEKSMRPFNLNEFAPRRSSVPALLERAK